VLQINFYIQLKIYIKIKKTIYISTIHTIHTIHSIQSIQIIYATLVRDLVYGLLLKADNNDSSIRDLLKF